MNGETIIKETIVKYNFPGWCKVVKGIYAIGELTGPCKLYVKNSWKEKKKLITEVRRCNHLVFSDGIKLFEGQYFKIEYGD